MGAYCQDLGNGYMRCANTPFAGAAWLLEAPAVEGSGHELRPTLSTVSGEFLGAEGRDAPNRFESQFAARPLADAANGYANAEANYNVASENAVTLDTTFGGPVTGALSGESAMDAVFRQAREEIAGVKVLTPASGDRADVGLPLSPYGVGSISISPNAQAIAGFDTADALLDNGNIAQLLGLDLRIRPVGATDEAMVQDQAPVGVSARSGAGVKPITQDPNDDKIPPPPLGEDPWGWAEKHGIMPDPGYGVPSLPTGENLGSCYCLLQCGKSIKSKPTKNSMSSIVWQGQPDNNTSCSLIEGEFLPCRLIIASRDGAPEPDQPYYIVEIIYRLAGPEPVQFAGRRVSIFLDGEPVPDIKPPVVSDRMTPCPSEVRFWIRADKPGPVLIHTGWNRMQPCGELHLNIAPLAYMMAYAPEQPVPPPQVPPPLPEEPPKPDILGDCGCEIACASLDLDNKPAQDKFQMGGCTITVDMTDPDAVRGNFVLGVLKLVGDDPVNLYGWSVQCLNDWLELNERIDFGDEGTADPSIGSEFHGLMHGEAKCGTEIPFLLRPTEAAYEALEKGDIGTLIETVIGKVGQQECPMEVYITGACDLEQFQLSLPTRGLPKVQLTLLPGNFVMPDNRRLPINMMMPEEWRRSEEYKYLPPGFSGGQGWSLFLHRKVEVDVESKWRPTDCCCLYITAIRVELRIDMVIEHPRFGFWQEDLDCLESAGKYLMSSKFTRQTTDSVRADLKLLRNISEFPICERKSKGDCDSWKRDIEIFVKSVVNNNLNLLMAPYLACENPCLPQSRSREPGTIDVNARGALEYWPTDPKLPTWDALHDFLPKVWSKPVADPFFSMDSVLKGLYVFEKMPCCILIWIHGYNTRFDEAQVNIERVGKMYQTDAEGCCKIFGYYWNGNPPDEKDFGAAMSAATLSAAGLVALVHYLQATYPGIPISMGAHSLGNYVMFQAMQLLNPGDIQFLFSIQAAISNKVFNLGKEGIYRSQLAKVQKTYVVFNKYDNVLADFFKTLLLLGIETKGVFEVFSGEEALGETGPQWPDDLPPEKVGLWDMSSRWRFPKLDLPGDELDRTTHSAIYYWNVSYSFWWNEIRGALDANVAGCNVR